MAIGVQVECSDCGTVTDQVLTASDKEIICPDCRRNMPSLPPEDFKQVEKTLTSQRILGIVSLILAAVAIALLWFWADPVTGWKATKVGDDYKRQMVDTTMFFAAAGGCMLASAIFGALSARKRYVVEI